MPHPVGPVSVLAIQIEQDVTTFFVVNSPEVLSVVGQGITGRVDVRDHRSKLGAFGDNVIGEDTKDFCVKICS